MPSIPTLNVIYRAAHFAFFITTINQYRSEHQVGSPFLWGFGLSFLYSLVWIAVVKIVQGMFRRFSPPSHKWPNTDRGRNALRLLCFSGPVTCWQARFPCPLQRGLLLLRWLQWIFVLFPTCGKPCSTRILGGFSWPNSQRSTANASGTGWPGCSWIMFHSSNSAEHLKKIAGLTRPLIECTSCTHMKQ